MRRMLMDELVKWKESKRRKPLLLKGMRQVGKTYLLMKFGRERYRDVAYFNFENNAALGERFQADLDPKRLIQELGIVQGRRIEPGETLIVFDEIQFCPEAITSLKYFQESANEFHIVCAGSLLGVALARPASYPVGKVDVMTLRPMCFEEYLRAAGEDMLVEYLLERAALLEPVARVFADKLAGYLREYLTVGGMPEAVEAWVGGGDMGAVDSIQKNLLNLYQLDFAKHAPTPDIPKLNMIWSSVPSQLAKENGKFVYGLLREGAGARQFENAMTWLESAGMAHKLHKIEKPAMPLSAYAKPSHFKLYAPDVGLLRQMAGLSAKSILEQDALFQEFRGAMIENYCLLELLSLLGETPYYWNSGNLAEVDFVAQFVDKIVPIEVKAADNVKAKSLHAYIQRYHPPLAVRASLRNLGLSDDILSCPLYLLFALPKMLGNPERA